MSLAALWPSLNAALNTLAAICLVLGYRSIRRGARRVHHRLMLGAVAVSTLFLASYLARTALIGTHRFPELGLVKLVYLVVLSTHMLAALVVVPLVLVTLLAALRARFERHQRLARMTWPIWIYASVTGVMVYAMLYHLAPALGR